MGALIGAAGGAGFYYAAPALANTGFFANFGTSGMIGAYTITGAAAGGAIGYGSGFTGGMLHSDGDWGYSHQSGMFGAQIGATVGSALGAAAGLLTPEGREWIAGMFSGPPTIDFSIPEYDPYSVTASLEGSGSYYQSTNNLQNYPNSSRAISYHTFYNRTKHLSYDQIITQRPNQFIFPGGPNLDIRYVIDPKNEKIIDMRHFLVVGYWGNIPGAIGEFGQLFFKNSRGSALNRQDFYSNYLGSKFFRWGFDARSDVAFSLQLYWWFQKRDPNY